MHYRRSLRRATFYALSSRPLLAEAMAEVSTVQAQAEVTADRLRMTLRQAAMVCRGENPGRSWLRWVSA